MNDKSVFRSQFFWTSESQKDSPPTNIFVKGYTLESAQKTAIGYFEQELIAHGLAGSGYRVETKPSSMNEALIYAQQKLSKQNTERSLN